MCSGFHQVVAANLQKYLKYCALSSKKVSVKLHQREFESLFPAPSFLLYSGAGIPILSPARSFPSSRAFLLFPVRISFLPPCASLQTKKPRVYRISFAGWQARGIVPSSPTGDCYIDGRVGGCGSDLLAAQRIVAAEVLEQVGAGLESVGVDARVVEPERPVGGGRAVAEAVG